MQSDLLATWPHKSGIRRIMHLLFCHGLCRGQKTQSRSYVESEFVFIPRCKFFVKIAGFSTQTILSGRLAVKSA
jgi:hypothetical protein